MIGDGGGKAPAFARGVVGADKVARVLATFFPLLTALDVKLEPHEVNGQPGAILRDRDDKVINTLTLDVLDGQIQAIRAVSNPDKLGHVGPVADARALAREARTAATDQPRLPIHAAPTTRIPLRRLVVTDTGCLPSLSRAMPPVARASSSPSSLRRRMTYSSSSCRMASSRGGGS